MRKNSHSIKEASRRVIQRMMATPAEELNERLAARETGPVGWALLDSASGVFLQTVSFSAFNTETSCYNDSYSGWNAADEDVEYMLIEVAGSEWLAAA